VTIGVAVLAALPAYRWLDSSGWIPHREDSTITARLDWRVGESKNCQSYPLSAELAMTAGKAAGYALSQVKCDDGPEQQASVRFFGRTEQPEYAVVIWKCTRKEDGVTCYELSGVRPQ